MKMYVIACHYGARNKVIAFRILDADTGTVQDHMYDEVKSVLAREIEIAGLELKDGEINGSNGSLSRYAKLVNNIPVNGNPVVILKEFPNKTYSVSNHLGQIATMNSEQLINYANSEGIANGKIVNTDDNTFVSSINGEFIKDKSFKEFESGKRTVAKLKMFGMKDFELDSNYLARGLNKDATEIQLPSGCLGIQPEGFKDFKKLEKVYLPKTCLELGEKAFMGCVKLEEINIQLGTLIIPIGCFKGCSSLKPLNIPMSVKKIDKEAFLKCNKLKTIYVGRGHRVEIEGTGLPLGCKVSMSYKK